MSSLAKELHELDKDSQIKLTTICPLGISGTGINIPTVRLFNHKNIFNINLYKYHIILFIFNKENTISTSFANYDTQLRCRSNSRWNSQRRNTSCNSIYFQINLFDSQVFDSYLNILYGILIYYFNKS